MVLYLNPAKDKVYLSNATIGTPFKIFDIKGLNVKSGLINNLVEEIDINELTPGVYYIDIKHGNFGNRRWKFVKE